MILSIFIQLIWLFEQSSRGNRFMDTGLILYVFLHSSGVTLVYIVLHNVSAVPSLSSLLNI